MVSCASIVEAQIAETAMARGRFHRRTRLQGVGRNGLYAGCIGCRSTETVGTKCCATMVANDPA
jgi:hypothetical protein